MTERLPTQTVSIPTKAYSRGHYEDAGEVMKLFRQAGIEPRKAIRNPLACEMARAWAEGTYTRGDFLKACANLLIMNPGLGM